MSERLFEGMGAPVRIAPNDTADDIDVDPTLDSCCQREIESTRRRNALETTLRAHDRVAQAETRRRQPLSLPSGYTYNLFNLIHTLTFGTGCRCCYDPNGDGGEYDLLAAARNEREVRGHQVTNESQHGGNHENDDRGGNAYGDSNLDSQNSDTDDEFDYLLDEQLETSSLDRDLQAARREELEAAARHYQVLRYHGYGVHRQMHPQRVFSYVGYRNVEKDGYVPAAAVLHLYDAYSSLSVSLDLCLEDMANRYPGTRFVRALGITAVLFAGDCEDSRKWKHGDLPTLLALKGGNVVAFSCGLGEFRHSGQEEVVTGAVEQWLDYAGVLMEDPPPMEAVCRIRPEEDVLLENMRQLRHSDKGHDEAENESRYDCGVDGCSKSFYHEHVGVKNDAQEGILVSESQVVSCVNPP